MKVLKRVVAITILASLLCGYCCLIGGSMKHYNKKVQSTYNEINIIAQETIIETENAIYYCEEFIPEEEVYEEEVIVIHNNRYTELIDSLTNEEKDLIYRITFREAGNQNEEGQRAVIEVILNRVLDESFPNTVIGVLSQPRQFSTWAGRENVTEDQIDAISPLLTLVYEEEPILNGNYVYFDGVQHSYGRNYVKIQDHWFAEK